MSRQRVNRALGVLQSEKIIRIDYGTIEILNKAELNTFDPDEF